MGTRFRFAIFAAATTMVFAWIPPAPAHRIGPSDIYPDPVRTLGAANPHVTQRNIQDNICNRQWSTRIIRPPSEYTSKLKRKQLREYGDTVHQARAELINPSTGKIDTTRCVAHSDNMACYEEDHLISLENGGDPMDPRNLWPEPYNTRIGGTIMGAHQKDVVEGFIHDEVCHDVPGAKTNSYIPATTTITLKRGQEILADDWYACYESIEGGAVQMSRQAHHPGFQSIGLPLIGSPVIVLLGNHPLSAMLIGIGVMFLVAFAAFLLYIFALPVDYGSGR